MVLGMQMEQGNGKIHMYFRRYTTNLEFYGNRKCSAVSTPMVTIGAAEDAR